LHAKNVNTRPNAAASSSTLPLRSTRPDRLTQTKFNQANGNIRGGAAKIIAGIRQPPKRKAISGKSTKPSKSQKTSATSDATSAHKRAPKAATVSDSDISGDDGSDEGSDDDGEDDENEVTKYERLRKEGEHDRAVRATCFV
jgi:hypothetical protein